MKLKHLLLILFNIAVGLLNAQSLAWYENIGSRQYYRHYNKNHVVIAQMEADSHFVYVLGIYDNLPLDFYQSQHKIPFLSHHSNAFLAQYDHHGNLNWVQILGSYAYYIKYRNHIMTLNKGHIYVSGAFPYRTLIGKDTVEVSRASVYLAKFNQNGQKIWHKTSEPTYWTNDNEPQNLTVDSKNNIYLSGAMRGTHPLTFDSLSGRLTDRQFVFKVDSTGKTLWATSAKQLQHLKNGWSLQIIDGQIDTQDNLFLLMADGRRNVSSSCDFTTWQGVISRVTPQGKMDSLCAIECSDLMSATALSLAENGDLYLAGRYRGQLTIGNFKSADKGCNHSTAFVARLTPKGRLIWYREGNSGEFSDIYQLKTEKDGNLLVMGRQDYEKHKSENRFRYPNYPAPYPNGEQRIFLKRISPFGASIDSVEWYTNDYNRNSYAENMHFAQSPQGNLFIGIEYECKLDTFSHSLCSEDRFTTPDSTLETIGSKVLIGRLSDKVLQKKQLMPTLTANQFRIFPNPTSDFIFMESNLPLEEAIMVTLYDMNGRVIQEITYNEKNKSRVMDLVNQPLGIYLLVMRKNGNLLFSTKILKI